MGGNSSCRNSISCCNVRRKGQTASTQAAVAAATRGLSRLCSTLLFVLCCCCGCVQPGAHRSSIARAVSSGTRSARVLQLSVAGLRQAAVASCSRGAFCVARFGGGTCSKWTALATTAAIARGRREGERRTTDYGAAGSGVWMKANKKNKRKREQRQRTDAGTL